MDAGAPRRPLPTPRAHTVAATEPLRTRTMQLPNKFSSSVQATLPQVPDSRHLKHTLFNKAMQQRLHDRSNVEGTRAFAAAESQTNSSALSSSLPTAPQKPMQRARVAVLITGLINHHRPHLPTSSIAESQQAMTVRTWLDSLEAVGVGADPFVYLELFDHPKKDRKNEVGAIYGRRSVPPNRLLQMIEIVRPVKLGVHNEEPFCVQWPHMCGSNCTTTWPRWLEQQHKIRRCLDMVRSYESETRRLYDFVIAFRSDYDLLAVGHNTRGVDVLHAIRRWPSVSHARVKPHTYGGAMPNSMYGQADWFWMAGREAAEIMAAPSRAPCAWFRCIHGTLNYSDPMTRRVEDVRNELLLIEWATGAGLVLAPMSREGTEPPAELTVGGTHRLPISRRCDVHVGPVRAARIDLGLQG